MRLGSDPGRCKGGEKYDTWQPHFNAARKQRSTRAGTWRSSHLQIEVGIQARHDQGISNRIKQTLHPTRSTVPIEALDGVGRLARRTLFESMASAISCGQLSVFRPYRTNHYRTGHMCKTTQWVISTNKWNVLLSMA